MTVPTSNRPGSIHSAVDCPGAGCDGSCAEPSTPGDRSDPIKLDPGALQRHLAASERPALPESRDERIAVAAHAILRCCGPDDMMDDGFERVFDAPVLVEFRVLTPSMPAAIALNHRAADAIMFDAGFSAISYSPPEQVGGGYVCAIRVPVGAP